MVKGCWNQEKKKKRKKEELKRKEGGLGKEGSGEKVLHLAAWNVE